MSTEKMRKNEGVLVALMTTAVVGAIASTCTLALMGSHHPIVYAFAWLVAGFLGLCAYRWFVR